jgi:uncharacterized repeat protein (TIGR01451 family)
MKTQYLLLNDLRVETLFTVDSGLLDVLEQSLLLTQERLQQFAADPEFGNKMALAFGSGGNATAFQTAWLTGDFSVLSKIEILGGDEINGANGAYAISTDRIYLSLAFLDSQLIDPDGLVGVLLEEAGHRIDARLNQTDSPGDEGELFAALVQGQTLSENDLQEIQSENDWATVELNGKATEIEQASRQIDIAAREADGLGSNFTNFTSGIDYTVYGTEASNVIALGPGHDLVYGRGGDDSITGGQNDDVLYGGAGNDILTGNSENDVLDGGGGKDILDGGSGDDVYRISIGSNSAGTIINDLGNIINPLGRARNTVGGSDTLLIYKENFKENPVEDSANATKESYQTIVPIFKDKLQAGFVGSQRDGTTLIIDLNKDGFINQDEDLSILYFYKEDGTPDDGYIENIIGEITFNDNVDVDLELTKVDSPDPVRLGENLTYTLTVFNNSTNSATEVTLTETLPKGVRLVSSSIIPTDNSNNILTFNLGTLAANATRTIDVVVTPTQTGKIINTASVGSKEADSDPDDNTRQQTTDVKVNSVYKLSSWKYVSNGIGIQTELDSTIYAEFPEGVIPNPNVIYKRGFIIDKDDLKPYNRSQVIPSEIINEDISNKFLNINEIFAIAKVTKRIVNNDKRIEAFFDLSNLDVIGDIPQASLAKLLGFNHFNWIQTVGPQISPDLDWYSGTRQDFENGTSKLVSNSGNILSGVFIDAQRGGNFIVPDLTSANYTFNTFIDDKRAKGWSINASSTKTADLTDPTGKKGKLIDDLNGVYLIWDEYIGLQADSKVFYLDIPGFGGIDNQYSQLLSNSGSTLGFRDSPNLSAFGTIKGTKFTTYLVAVIGNEASQLFPINNSVFQWYSTVSDDIGVITATGTGSSLDISVDPSILTGGIEITDENLTLVEISQEEKQFLEENGIDIAPPNVNLSVIRTDDFRTIDIGQDYTYTLKITNNGSDPATQVVLTEALPLGVDFISATTTTPSAPSSSAFVLVEKDGLITAQLGTLNYGESAFVNFTVRSIYSGTLYGATDITSDEYDTDVTDNFLVSSKAINFVPINNFNPIARRDFVGTNENTPIIIPLATLLVNDKDTDGDTLTIADLSNATNGTVEFSVGGILFTPATNFSGDASFEYGLSDGKGGTAKATVTITVEGKINQPPIVQADKSLLVVEDSISTSLNITAPTDVESDALAIVVNNLPDPTKVKVQLANGTDLTINQVLTISDLTGLMFLPLNNTNGTAGIFSYTVSDGQGGTSVQTVTINITPVNDAPTGSPIAILASGVEDTPYTISISDLLLGFTDVDGDTLSVSSLIATNGAITNNGNSTYTFTPNADYNGIVNLTYNVDDGNGGSVGATQSFNIAAFNNSQATSLIHTSAGDGELKITVNKFGQFGQADVGGNSGTYDPLGTKTSASTTFESFIALGIISTNGATSARTQLSPSSSNDEIFTNVTGNNANSTFTVGGLRFQLNQFVQDIFDGTQTRTGGRLDQVYTITNTTNQTIDFDLVRYVDGDLDFDGSLIDGGGRIAQNGQEILFETDSGGSAQTDSTFFGITGTGGTIPATNHWEIDQFDRLRSSILRGNDLRDRIVRGDGNSDGFIDASAEYDITLGLRNVFSLAPGQSTTYSSITRFGSGEAAQLDITPPTVDIGILPTTTLGNNIDVSWSATDPSGIKNYDVFVSVDGGAFTPWQTNITTTSAVYIGEIGKTYTFYSLATDNAGNEQIATAVPTASTQLIYPITLDVTPVSVNEDGTTNLTYTFTRAGSAVNPLTVNYSVGGTATFITDYSQIGADSFNSAAGTVTFAAGSNTASIIVDPAANTINEPNKIVTLTIARGLGYTIGTNTIVAGTIIDDDALTPPLIKNSPAGADSTILLNEDTIYTFSTSDFGFSDPSDSPANNLSQVKITALPVAGTLKLDAIAVTTGDFIPANDITGGKLTFTPAVNANGIGYSSLTFQVQDDGGTANGGIDLDPSPNTLTFNVTPVNDPATLSGTATASVTEDATTPTLTAIGTLTVTDIDPGENKFSTTAISAPSNLGTLSITDTGSYTYTIDNSDIQYLGAGQTKTETFTVQSLDGTATQNITINLNGINDEPEGTDNTVTTLIDTPYTFTPSDFGFSDPQDIPANNLLAIKISTLPTKGTLTHNGTPVNTGDSISVADLTAGTLQFIPEANTKGLNYANFTFQVQDDGGTANGGIDLDLTPNLITLNVAPSGSSTGDPHILTFDGLHYDFQATGDFVLVKALDSDLEIQVRQAPWSVNPATTLNVGLATTVDGKQLEFSIDQPFPLLDGIPLALALNESQPLGNGSISRTSINGYGTQGDLYTVNYANGDRLLLNVYADFLIDPTLHLNSSQTVIGLLGNNNGLIEDDLALRNGTLSPQANTPDYLLTEFAASWQVTPETSLFRNQPLPLHSQLLMGTAGSNNLIGGLGNDILVGIIPSQHNPGTGEIDLLTGSQGSDTFVLGDKNSTFYGGAGAKDYALIQDLNSPEGDSIQLKGSSNDYVLGSASAGQATGTGIFLASDSTELVGIIQGVYPQGLSLSQPIFQYV